MNGFVRRFGVDEGLELSGAFGDAADRIEPGQNDAIAGRANISGIDRK